MTQAEKVIAVARAELGYTETPANSNRTKYGAAYGLDGQPWCVMFLWWVFRTAGLSELFYDSNRTAACGPLLRWAQGKGLTVPVSDVQPGDIVILNFSGTNETQHCGLVVEERISLDLNGNLNDVEPHVRKEITTIEGNTSPGLEGSQDNGGCVALKSRYPKQIVGVIRPQWKMEKPPDYVGHWAEKSILWGLEHELLTGYKDGSFQPDKEMTRAEVITLLKRYHDMGDDGK